VYRCTVGIAHCIAVGLAKRSTFGVAHRGSDESTIGITHCIAIGLAESSTFRVTDCRTSLTNGCADVCAIREADGCSDSCAHV